MYYLRTRPAADAIKFTVDAQALKETAGGPAVSSERRDSDSPMKPVGSSPSSPSIGSVASGHDSDTISIGSSDPDRSTDSDEQRKSAAIMCSLDNRDDCLMCSG